MSRIVRINNGDYDLYVTPDGTITFHDEVVIGDPIAGTGNLLVGHDATIQNDVTIQHDITIQHNASILNDVTVGNDLAIGDAGAGTGDLSVAHDATIQHNVIIGNSLTVHTDLTVETGVLSAPSADIDSINVTKLIGDPIEIDSAIRFKNKIADPTLVSNSGIVVYGKEQSNLLWYVDCDDKVHSIADTRKALAYSLIF